MDLPKQYILQYIVKKNKKEYPTWQDINELKIAAGMDQMDYDVDEEYGYYFTKALERIKYDVEKLGVMISFVHPEYPSIIAIGYSLVNKKAGDKFDYQVTTLGGSMGPVGYFEADGFGKHIAIGRAVDWSTPETILRKAYPVPPSIKAQFKQFIERSQRYYKDKEMPAWVRNFLALNSG